MLDGVGAKEVRFYRNGLPESGRGTKVTEYQLCGLQKYAKMLRITSTQYQEALALAECLRCIDYGKSHNIQGFANVKKPFAPDLAEFAEEIMEDYVVAGKSRGRTGKPFNDEELLLLLALYILVTFPSEAVRLFSMLSLRSIEGVKDKFNSVVKEVSRAK